MGLIPFLGDSSKVLRVIGKYLDWLSDLRVSLTRWLMRLFPEKELPIRRVILNFYGYKNEFQAFVARTDAEQLAANGNDSVRLFRLSITILVSSR